MYMKECMKARPNPTAKFNYAWALIRSKEVRYTYTHIYIYIF